MADITTVVSKTNESIDKQAFSRIASKKPVSFEQSLISKDFNSFSSACVRGKLYQMIQSGQNSTLSYTNTSSFNIHKTNKHGLYNEHLIQFAELLDSQQDLQFSNLTFQPFQVVNGSQRYGDEVVMEVSDEFKSHSNSQSINNNNNNSIRNSNKDDLVVSTEIHNCKRCEECNCVIF
jgi:hypothetical protein